jgi:cell fate (sporulation/competence/biofilm development) regulator YlbF (YheA/YmcA/DUF963 family)
MVNIYDYAHNLARALKECQEYKAYKEALAKIKGKPVERLIADFHKRQLELQAQVFQGKELTEAQKEGLQNLYTALAQHPDAAAFLAAEQRLGTLVGDITKIIGEAVEMETFGLGAQ